MIGSEAKAFLARYGKDVSMLDDNETYDIKAWDW